MQITKQMKSSLFTTFFFFFASLIVLFCCTFVEEIVMVFVVPIKMSKSFVVKEFFLRLLRVICSQDTTMPQHGATKVQLFDFWLKKQKENKIKAKIKSD